MAKKKYKKTAIDYAVDVAAGKIIKGNEEKMACERFLEDLKRDDLTLRTKEPDFVIGIVERLMVHQQGEDMQGRPLRNKPLILQPWQVFCVYNLVGFYYKGAGIRRFKEGLIEIPRKNGKTLFIAALAFGIALLERKSGSKIYIAAASLRQAQESFNDILYSLRYRRMLDEFRIRDNNAEHSIHKTIEDEEGRPEGSIDIEALAANPDKHDSLNSNIQIIDELHKVSGSEYERLKESGKAYRNSLCLCITTAGDNANSFAWRHQEYAIKVVNGTVKDDSMFVFICRADVDDKGYVDYTSAEQHQKANPSYGITISPEEIMNEALQAQNDPQKRKGFLSRSLNIYTSAMKAWFDIEEFRRSDRKYKWTLDELAKLPVKWYGGADLSRMYDLTAAALVGVYQGTLIIITHAFFPVTQAAVKADEDQIPLFGWQDDGWLTMCNSPTVNYADVVNWFKDMRTRGFKIRVVGHDRKFAGKEYFPAMKKAGFRIVDQPQYFYLKSQGFRYIEKAAKDGNLYYLHSEMYEYAVQNISAVEKTDDAVQYQKIEPELRIDPFDASVFACVQLLEDANRQSKGSEWWGNGTS